MYNPFSSDFSDLLQRYESMIERGEACTYFDAEEFGEIIDEYLMQAEPRKALLAVNEAIKQHHSDIEILLRKAYIHSVIGEPAEANDIVARLVPNNLYSTESVMLLSQVLMQTGRSAEGQKVLADKLEQLPADEEKVDVLLYASEYAMMMNDTRRAEQYLRYAYEITPADVDVLFALTRFFKSVNDVETASYFYKKWSDTTPADEVLWWELADFFEQIDEDEEAIEVYDRLIATFPKSFGAYLRKVDLLMASNEYDEALNTLAHLVEQEPTYADEVACIKGKCYEGLERWSDATACYKQVIERDNLCAEGYHGMASVMQHYGNHDACFDFLQVAVALHPNQIYCLFNLAKAYLKKQDVPKAQKILEDILKIDIEFPDPWLLLSQIQAKTNRRNAIKTLKEALKYNPDEAEICYELASLYYQDGRMPSCLDYLKKGMQEDVDGAEEFFAKFPDAFYQPKIFNLYKRILTKE